MKPICAPSQTKVSNRILPILLLLSPALMLAQTTSPGFDSLYALQLNQKLAWIGSNYGFKGLSVAAYVPGQGIWVGTWGLADHQKPVTPDMRFGIASNTKAFVAALLLKLQEEGILQINDPVAKYLPPYPHVNGQITLRQLLTHASGLYDYINQWSAATSVAYNNNPDSVWTMTDLIKTIGPPVFQPGKRYGYSNTNYLLAGMVAETAADTTIRYLLHSRIFEPLGLNMAYPPVDDVFAAPFANLWQNNQWMLVPGASRTFLSFPATAGGIWATAYDMVRWYQALFGNDWLSPHSQRELRNHDGYSAYALGLRVQNNYNTTFFYHGGAWGYRSYMMHEPATGISLCVLSNFQGKGVGVIVDELFREIKDKRPKKPSDVTIVKIYQPAGTLCEGDSLLSFTIKNNGTTSLNQILVKYGWDGHWADSFLYNLNTPLMPDQERQFNWPLTFPLFDYQRHRFQLCLLPPGTDGYTADNLAYSDYRLSLHHGLSLPYKQGFESTGNLPENWFSGNPENLLDWRQTAFAAKEGSRSLARNNYWDANQGNSYILDLPPLDIVNNSTTLTFSFAHVASVNYEGDQLLGYISTDCGKTFVPLFVLEGPDFQTAPATDNIFLPTSAQWQTRTYSLQDFAGKNIIMRIESVNGYGNVCYIDDIEINYLESPAEEIPAFDSVRIYPNPATTWLNLDLPLLPTGESLEVSLWHAYGRIVYQRNLAGLGTYMIQRNAWPPGVYFLKFAVGGQVVGMYKVIFL